MSRRCDPILLVAAEGMLGRAWLALLADRRLYFTATEWPEFDITDMAAVEKFIHPNYETVINCAAWTDVDAAETHSSNADLINGTAVVISRRASDSGESWALRSPSASAPGSARR